MKVLILSNDAPNLYSTRYELIEELCKNGYEVDIVFADGFHREQFEEIGANIHLMDVNRHSKNPFNDLKILKKYNQLIKQIRPDVVLTYNIKPNIYGGIVARINRTPYITNITGLGTAVEYPGITQKITTTLYKIAVKDAYCVFFQNSHNKAFFEKHNIKHKRNRIIPGSGVNLDRFQVYEYPDSDTITFTFIARILKEKGIDEYIEAAKYIKEKHPNTLFNVIGPCDNEKYVDVLKDADKAGIIHYYGMQKNVVMFHKDSNCTILPSYYPEGMNNVLLESAACGRPIITTNRSGCGEIVDDGVTGYVVNQKDSKDLIDKIEKFLKLSSEQRKEMGLAGRRKVEKEFDRRIVVKAYMEEIQNIKQNN